MTRTQMLHGTDAGRLSRYALFTLFILVLVLRVASLTPNELSWDVFGYYIYLPSTFIHHDFLLHDPGWLNELVSTRPEITGTLYQLSTAPDGSPMYFFFMGMAILYLPFFLVAHLIAMATGQPMDGFSQPYQVWLAVGCTAYTLIGLIHWRRILLAFFSDRMAAALLLIVCLGTNWLHFMTVKNLETANALSMLMTVLVWNTMEWHRTQRFRNMAYIAFSLALMTLVKPSEALAGLLPLLWGVHDGPSLRAKWTLLNRHGLQLLGALGIGLAVLLPQVLYWWAVTGSPVYDSYKNPGVGLDLWQPHVGDILFSFKKGWLLYTPVMVFALIGFFSFRKRRRAVFPAILIWFLAEFWVVSSWSEWWYGASFSVRPMITSYALLALPMGTLMQAVAKRGVRWRWGLGAVLAALIALNLFQTWQLNAGILDPYRTTKAYYMAILGRTSVPPGAETLKSLERTFDGTSPFRDLREYRRINIGHYDFDLVDPDHAAHHVEDPMGQGRVLRMDSTMQFSPGTRNCFAALTDRDHLLVRASVRVFLPSDFRGEAPCLVFSMEHEGKSYGYTTESPSAHPDSFGKWQKVTMERMSPPIREKGDVLVFYVWGRSASPIYIDDLDVNVFVPK